MSVGFVPSEERGRSKVFAQPIDVGDCARNHGTRHRRFADTGEEATRDGEGRKSMSDDVHDYVLELVVG